MLPLPESALRSARADLRDHRGTVVETEEGTLLVVRSPRASPDLVADIEETVLYLAAEDLEVDDALLVGEEGATRVDPAILRRQMRDRDKADADRIAGVRDLLEEPFDWTLFRDGPRRDVLRLAVKVPRSRAGDLAADDLVPLEANLGPVRGTPKGGRIRTVYVVADEDFARMDAARFFDDLQEATGGGDDVPARTVATDRLTDLGYTLVPDPGPDGVDVAAERDDRTLLVAFRDRVAATDVASGLSVLAGAEADVLVLVATAADEAARRAAFGTPVEIVDAADVEAMPA